MLEYVYQTQAKPAPLNEWYSLTAPNPVRGQWYFFGIASRRSPARYSHSRLIRNELSL